MRNKLKITVIIPFLGGKSLSLQSYSFYSGSTVLRLSGYSFYSGYIGYSGYQPKTHNSQLSTKN